MTGYEVTGPLLFLVGIILYFLPAVNGYSRGHHNAGPILVLIFLGWTFLGWVAALAWSGAQTPKKKKKKKKKKAPVATNTPAVPYNVQKIRR